MQYPSLLRRYLASLIDGATIFVVFAYIWPRHWLWLNRSRQLLAVITLPYMSLC